MKRRDPVVLDLTERKPSVIHYDLKWDREFAWFFGRWFRYERQRLDLDRLDIAERLGIATAELAEIERTNGSLKGAWIGPMAKIGFQFALYGTWFRIEREQLGISRPALATRLGVNVRFLQKLETASPAILVPPELVAQVIAIGFRIGAYEYRG